MWRKWLNRRVAALLEYHLTYNYMDSRYMCNCLMFDPVPKHLTLFGFVTRKAKVLVTDRIKPHGTLIGYLSNTVLKEYHHVDAQFLQEAGIPFYRNLIKELRET